MCVCFSSDRGETGGHFIRRRGETLKNVLSTQAHKYTDTKVYYTYSHTWGFKMRLYTQCKSVHMHLGRYCYMHIEIKLASTITFLPGAAEPICKHQRTYWLSLFKTHSHLPNPNSISTDVFIQNAFSLTVANYILIHEALVIEEIV